MEKNTYKNIFEHTLKRTLLHCATGAKPIFMGTLRSMLGNDVNIDAIEDNKGGIIGITIDDVAVHFTKNERGYIEEISITDIT